MKIAFFYPPVGNACQPYLSTPTLVAHLKHHGFEDVKQYDFNIEAVDELLITIPAKSWPSIIAPLASLLLPLAQALGRFPAAQSCIGFIRFWPSRCWPQLR